MSDEKAVTVVQQQPAAPSTWGEREEVAAIAKRLRSMLPGGDKLTEGQIYAAAQYARLTGLDPFSGGFYSVENGGITDGYKTLVAWAQDKEGFTDKYYPLSEDQIEAEGYEKASTIEAWACYLIRRSQQPLLVQLLSAGLDVHDALDLIGHRGVGVVLKADLVTKKGTAKEPPKTKSWAWVARKRALRAAIAVGYGQPTLTELAALGRRAQAEGWADLPGEALPRAAALSAITQQVIEASAGMTIEQHEERLQENTDLLRGVDEGAIGEEPEIINPVDLYAPIGEGAQQFYERVVREIPYFGHVNHVRNTLAQLGQSYDPANEDALLDVLDVHARQKADEKAGAATQPELFEAPEKGVGEAKTKPELKLQ